MGKWYEVKVKITKVFAIEVEDDEGEEQATMYATAEVESFDDVDCSTEITDPVEIDRLKRHADVVLEDA